MIARVGNGFYWMTILIVVGCIGWAIYLNQYDVPSMVDYTSRYHSPYMPDISWDELQKEKFERTRNLVWFFLGAGAVASIIGKAIQYIFGGKWSVIAFIEKERGWGKPGI